MFCRLGSVLDSRPVAATVWLKVVWMRPSSPTDLSSPSTVDLQLGHVAVAQQVLQQRVLGLRVQPVQRVGVGGVAGLDPLGLRQAQLVEQDLLQLLGRAEVELPADHRVRAPARRALTSAANCDSSSDR